MTASRDPAPDTAHRFNVLSGYHAKASASSIAFLWSNWEVLQSISPGTVRIQRLDDKRWKGNGFGGYGEWYTSSSRIGVNEGRFEFFSWVRFLGQTARGNSVFEYKRVDPDTLYYYGHASGDMPRSLRPLSWFVDVLTTFAAAKICNIGGKTAAAITADPKLVEDHADPVKYELFRSMLAEEESLQGGAACSPQHFNINHAPHEDSGLDNIGSLRYELRKLQSNLDRDQRRESLSDHLECLNVFGESPKMAVAQTRAILEPMVKQLYEFEFQESVHGIALQKQVDRLYWQSNRVPRDVTSIMQTIIQLGNIAMHQNSHRINAAHFKVAFNALLTISEWFFCERPNLLSAKARP